jgi:hypothetical protein
MEKRKLDEYTETELIAAFFKYFGGRRAIGILGWCFVGSMSGASSPGELMRKLQAQGLSETAIYQSLWALRDFQEYIEEVPLPRRDLTVPLALMMRIGNSKLAFP